MVDPFQFGCTGIFGNCCFLRMSVVNGGYHVRQIIAFQLPGTVLIDEGKREVRLTVEEPNDQQWVAGKRDSGREDDTEQKNRCR